MKKWWFLELQENHRALENAFTHFFGEQSEKYMEFQTRHDQLELALGACQDSNNNRHTELGEEPTCGPDVRHGRE